MLALGVVQCLCTFFFLKLMRLKTVARTDGKILGKETKVDMASIPIYCASPVFMDNQEQEDTDNQLQFQV